MDASCVCRAVCTILEFRFFRQGSRSWQTFLHGGRISRICQTSSGRFWNARCRPLRVEDVSGRSIFVRLSMRFTTGCGRAVRGRCCRTTSHRIRPCSNTSPAGATTERGSVCMMPCDVMSASRTGGKRPLQQRSWTASPRKPQRLAANVDTTPARKSKDVNDIFWSIHWDC